jgi:nucleotide-binding universal stress UspA family protein
MSYTDIVVGIDDSDSSTRALHWAAAQARRWDARLRILTAFSWTWPREAFGGLGEQLVCVRQRFEEVLAKAVAEAWALEPRVEITGSVVLSDPARALLEAGRTATLVVVGNRGHGGFASLLLGSVGQQVVTHTTGTVVVVRGRADAAPAPIVVGVDGSPSAGRALELAFEEAQRRDCGLIAVRGYTVPIPPVGVDVPPMPYDEDAVRQAATDQLDSAVTPLREKYPTVAVKAIIEPGSPARSLVGLSSAAGLLIVGSRGRGALLGSLTGSVGLQLLHHADCPVMIVRG